MRRREFIAVLRGAAIAWPLTARAQQPGKIPTVGILLIGPGTTPLPTTEAFQRGLRDLGWIEGRNIAFEIRWAPTPDRLPEIAAELVRINVDVILAGSSTQVEPARRATQTIPIVFAVHADPIGTGHVASLARPGGNITGLSQLLTELSAKELETEGGRAAGDAHRRPVEPHHTVSSAGAEIGRGGRREAGRSGPNGRRAKRG